MALSAPLQTERTTGQFAAKRVMAFLKEIGLKGRELILKEQEQAMKAVIDDVMKLRTGTRTIPEQSPVKSSGSNGIVERAIQSVEMQMRVMKSVLESRWGMEVPDAHAIMVWMAEYVAFLLNRFEVGHDGKTAYERLKGKKAKVNGLEFAEGVLFKKKASQGQLGKLNIMWEDGIYLGVKGRVAR